MQMYDRIKQATDTNDALVDTIQREQLANRLTEFQFFLKKVEPFLNGMKNQLITMLTTKQTTLQGYNQIKRVLDSYEELNLAHYTNMDASKLIFTNPNNAELKENLVHTAENLRNPFTDIYHWVKGEIYDLKALNGAIQVRNNLDKQGQQLVKKRTNTAKNLDDVNAGKKTLGTLFKSEKDAGGMAN